MPALTLTSDIFKISFTLCGLNVALVSILFTCLNTASMTPEANTILGTFKGYFLSSCKVSVPLFIFTAIVAMIFLRNPTLRWLSELTLVAFILAMAATALLFFMLFLIIDSVSAYSSAKSALSLLGPSFWFR